MQINFDAIILSGEERGERVKGSQIIDNMFNYGMPEVERGDKVLLVKYKGQEDMEWQMMEFLRTDKLIILGLLFVLALLFFGRFKGFNTIVSLVFTCVAVFWSLFPQFFLGIIFIFQL